MNQNQKQNQDYKDNSSKNRGWKASFSGRKFRSGAYMTILSVVVIIIIIVANLLVSKLDMQFDMSESGLYTISDETENYLNGLQDDISIYYMVQEGNETMLFEKIAKQYDKLSGHIKLENKDPLLYPQFASQYVDDEVTDNSFIVVNNTTGKAKYINGQDMLVQEFDYNTYQTQTTGIDVEGELTSAILSITTEDIPVLYVTQGHGETEPGDTVRASISKMNVDIQNLSTLTTERIPTDCDILFINSPKKDFSNEETTMIKNYLSEGGKAIITLDYDSVDLNNFASILDYYGIKMTEGFLVETDMNRYIANRPEYLIPMVESHNITFKASDSDIPVFMPISSGLVISDTSRGSLSVTPLLSTSDGSYSKTNPEPQTYEKEEGDIDGPFYLGLLATDTYNDITTDIVVFSCENTFTDATSDYANSGLLAGTIGYLMGDMETISIPTKSLQESYITLSQMDILGWGALTVAGIPLIIIILGTVICLRRRKK